MSEKDKYPSELAERFQIRLPPGLRDRIKAAAEANSRSMNTEIVVALEDAFPDPKELRVSLDFMDRIDNIKSMLDEFRAALGEAGLTLEDVEKVQKKQQDDDPETDK